MHPTLGTIAQLAYVVDDVATAARRFAATTGAGPFFLRRTVIDRAHGGGAEAGEFDHSSAYGQWGALQVELIEVHSAAPAAFAATTARRGRIHHVATFVPSFSAEQARLEALGCPALLTATTSSGHAFAFHDTRSDAGHLIEIYEPAPSILALYAKVAAAADGWDGRRPVREF
ncbi:VOC family protein [Gordonia lacunae]|uniref:VOC domain-containing protein n=1 Tax=Gordonia lacunae TaxID=417102 RepID=A0A2C9ZJ33_9ACTN|nr:VOC family protein [Gordonia lacunae]OUC78003.1 hypothetical protein CA982_14965 [Gordonia lacunae]